jgi:hypothetical protein
MTCRHRHPIQCIIPPYIVEHMAHSADPALREMALVALAAAAAVGSFAMLARERRGGPPS